MDQIRAKDNIQTLCVGNKGLRRVEPRNSTMERTFPNISVLYKTDPLELILGENQPWM